MRYYISLVFAFILFLVINPTTAEAVSGMEDDSVPAGQYYVKNGKLYSSTGVEASITIEEIMTLKQSDIITQMEDMASEGFRIRVVDGDLDISGGGSFWATNPRDLYSRTSGTTFYIRQGSTGYPIYVPKGQRQVWVEELQRFVTEDINESYIADAIGLIEKYKSMVREGVLVGSIGASYNIYSMYPDNQVPVTDLLKDVRSEDGQVDITGIQSSRVRMNYSLDYFFNPIFGKMDASDVKYISWKQKSGEVNLTYSSDSKVTVPIDQTYIAFLDDQSDDRKTLADIDSSAVLNADGVRNVKPSLAEQRTINPKSMVDVSMRLMLPETFSKVRATGNYELKQDGFRIIQDIKLLITHGIVFMNDGGVYKEVGDYNDFGIYDESLVLYQTRIDKDGNYNQYGKRVGVVIPLWYKEAIIDTSSDKLDTYITGRDLKFGNDYSGKLSLTQGNRDLFAVDSKASGLVGERILYYAFPERADYRMRNHHVSVTHDADFFKISLDFVDLEHVRGFVMYRNNWFADDQELVLWLQSNEARAITGVEADELYKLITGQIDKGPADLEYHQWLRLQEIRGELDRSLPSKLFSVIRVITIIFGVFLIVYSILLGIAYWLDIFNVLVDFSLLNMISFRRYYPITSKEDISYITYDRGGVRYITFFGLLVVILSGIAIGVMFIFATPIIEFLIYVYDRVVTWTGVI